MKFPRTAVSGLVAAGILLSSGAAYAATRATPTATATDTIVTTTSGQSLGAAGGVRTTIATIGLPPGSFVLHASGDFVNYGASDYTRCQIVVAGTPVAGVSALVGDPTAAGAIGPAGLISPFALTGGVVNRTAGTVPAALRCWHDNSNGASPYVDGDASLWAHKTTGLKLATQ